MIVPEGSLCDVTLLDVSSQFSMTGSRHERLAATGQQSKSDTCCRILQFVSVLEKGFKEE